MIRIGKGLREAAIKAAAGRQLPLAFEYGNAQFRLRNDTDVHAGERYIGSFEVNEKRAGLFIVSDEDAVQPL